MSNVKGNLTTIVKFAIMTIAPYLGMAEATQNQTISVIVAIIGLLLAYFDAKYDNTIFTQPNIQENTKREAPQYLEEDAINPEYTSEVDDDGA